LSADGGRLDIDCANEIGAAAAHMSYAAAKEMESIAFCFMTVPCCMI
jgi:hypothetical protein